MKKMLRKKPYFFILFILLCIDGAGCTLRKDSADNVDTAVASNPITKDTEEETSDVHSNEDHTINMTDGVDQPDTEKQLVDEGIHNNEHNIYTGTIGNKEIRMRITRTDTTLSASYITRNDEEKFFSGKIENNSANFILTTENNEYLNGKITKDDEGFINLNGEGLLSGKNIDFSVQPNTFFPIGDDLENYYSYTGYSSEEAEEFAQQIKISINNETLFSELINYPISVKRGENGIVIKNKEELLDKYDWLMQQNHFQEQIAQIFTKYMFANYQGICIENGIIWFNKDITGDYKIIAINID